MQTAKERYRGNLNFIVMVFFVLLAFTAGYYFGILSSKGAVIETGTTGNSFYQNIWVYRVDIFNLLIIAIAYVFVVMLGLVIFGRNFLSRSKNSKIEGIERLGELYSKGLLTAEEFESQKSQWLDDNEGA